MKKALLLMLFLLGIAIFSLNATASQTPTEVSTSFTQKNPLNGDMNGDGRITLADVLLLLKICIGDNTTDTDSNAPTESQPTSVLDNGMCGDTLEWELLSDGTLHIFGTGRMYDYVKYDTQKASPWYKYRDEPYISEDGTMFLNPDGSEYVSTAGYYEKNPNDYKVKKVVIDEGVTYIGNWAFYRICVDELTIPEGVTETGYFCIRFSPTLKTVNLPNSLEILDDFGISRNQVLQTVNFGNSLKTIGFAGLQSNPNLLQVTLPDSCTEIGTIMHESYSYVGANNGALGVMDGCRSLESVDLGSVTRIPQRAFLNCESLKSVIIPNTVTSIDVYAFRGCTSLETVEFEENSTCTVLEAFSFGFCSSLKSITGGTALKNINLNALNSSFAIETFEFSDANETFSDNLFWKGSIKEAHIGPNVTTVPTGMFSSSKLEKIFISKSVTEIKEYAIHTCTALTDIYYDGTLSDWNKISKATGWSGGVPQAAVIHFADGTTQLLANCK